MDVPDHGSTTVAFHFEALQRLHDPATVFTQTTGWARSVGIVSDRPAYVITQFARSHGLDYGFHSAHHGLEASLPRIRSQPEHEADRYLLIGQTELDASAVTEHGWAFLSIDEAATAADWSIGTTIDPDPKIEEDRGWP